MADHCASILPPRRCVCLHPASFERPVSDRPPRRPLCDCFEHAQNFTATMASMAMPERPVYHPWTTKATVLPPFCLQRRPGQFCGRTREAQRSQPLCKGGINLLVHLIVRSRKVSKPGDLYSELSDRSEIWQAPQQHCCRCACQILKWCDDLNYQSHRFEDSRDLRIKRLIGYWSGAQVYHNMMLCIIWQWQFQDMYHRADSRIVPSQWKTALLCNDISHWLGTKNLESALYQTMHS